MRMLLALLPPWLRRAHAAPGATGDDGARAAPRGTTRPPVSAGTCAGRRLRLARRPARRPQGRTLLLGARHHLRASRPAGRDRVPLAPDGERGRGGRAHDRARDVWTFASPGRSQAPVSAYDLLAYAARRSTALPRRDLGFGARDCRVPAIPSGDLAVDAAGPPRHHPRVAGESTPTSFDVGADVAPWTRPRRDFSPVASRRTASTSPASPRTPPPGGRAHADGALVRSWTAPPATGPGLGLRRSLVGRCSGPRGLGAAALPVGRDCVGPLQPSGL